MLVRTTGEKIFDVFLFFLMTLIVIVTLYPFWSQVVLSLSSNNYSTGLQLLPKGINFDAYRLAFEYKALWTGYLNTILRAVLGVCLSVTLASMVAYPLSKMDLPFNKIFSAIILFTMLFSGGLIPNYLLIQNLGIYNTIWALVLPNLIGVLHVFILRNFFRSIPASLEESALVDGAGYFYIFWRIIIPLSKPVIATVALWVAVHHWNEWFLSMIYISDQKKQVLQVILRKIIIENNMTDITALVYKQEGMSDLPQQQLQATMIMFSIIPMLIIYPFIQKYFVKGIMIGSVKG